MKKEKYINKTLSLGIIYPLNLPFLLVNVVVRRNRISFTYDLANRLVSQREYTGTGTSGGTLVSSTDFTYADKTNYLIGVKHNSPLGKMDISYIYGNIQKGYMPDQVYFVNWNGERKLSNMFDALGRLEKRWYAGNTAFYTKYAYEDVGTDKTTTLVKSAETPAGTYTYTYDAMGNIISVNDGTYTTSYVYDSLNQLIRENDERAGKTYTYAYTNGNITDKKTYSYTTGELGVERGYKTWEYENSTWGDLLTNYDGTEITYDEIGNPVTYGAASLEWQGRQLQSITEDGVTAGYEYNGEGQRVSKTFDGVTTEFYYNGSILAGQKTGEDTILFEYDSNGDPFAFLYNGTEYFYVKNAQNDVTAIANATGTVLANYYYDAWGNILTISGDTALANANPIRYRSYYCDTETGWYYLNSRYYAPEMCRFLNADGYVQTGQGMLDKNMFAYCENNPINRKDPSGGSWIAALVVAVIVAVSSVALSGCSAKKQKASPPANYVKTDSKNQNCYSYAFGLQRAANPGDYSVSKKNKDYMYKSKNAYTTAEISRYIERDMKALNKSVRIVDSPSDKTEKEYIVAMKTSSTIIPSIGVADYHFAVQLSDGTWADKPGQTPSRWNALDGTALTWDCGNMKGYYDTESVYFAVEK